MKPALLDDDISYPFVIILWLKISYMMATFHAVP